MHRKLLLAASALFVIALIITGPGCDELITESNTTVVFDYPEAEFSANKREGCAPCTVTLSDESNGPVDSWSWVIRYSDSIVDSSRDTNPQFVFIEPGFYSVSLLVGDSLDRTDSESKTRYILVSNPIADFTTGGDLLVCVGTRIEFINLSTGGITDYKWMFYTADSSIIDSSYRSNPDYTFTQPGVYSVSLTVSGACGDSTIVREDLLDVRDCAAVSWTVNGGLEQDTVCELEPVTVDFTVTGDIDSIYWFFEVDDSVREDISPVIYSSYTGSGSKRIYNKVYTEGLVVGDTLNNAVYVKPLAVATFSTGQIDSNVTSVTFTANQAVSNATSYFWDFGDGATSISAVANHAYDTAGDYEVFLAVDNDCNNPDTLYDTITVTDSTSFPAP
ncbi:PKD domain-containing protein [bacterium]|nr:PKD domain-containing protein [bacterium]